MPAIDFQQIYEECQRAGSGKVFFFFLLPSVINSWSNSLVMKFTEALREAVTFLTLITIFIAFTR